jgi:2-dehydro-3-deoxyphosphogluconate aldolase/(4S)-4-hydroxy-2-oxoglutarate aldolase
VKESIPFDAELFGRLPVVGILRGFDRSRLEPLVRASLAGGLCNIEITMNSPAACDLLRFTRELVGTKMNVGAGTVCSIDDLNQALDAGAGFIVTPVVVPEVIERCVAKQIPVFPGALTPTEIHQAWNLGATMVKVFPANHFGPDYIKAVKAPLQDIRLMPTGGVSIETLPAYKQAGADAFGVGSPLFDARRVANEDWDWVRDQAQGFVEAYRDACQAHLD